VYKRQLESHGTYKSLTYRHGSFVEFAASPHAADPVRYAPASGSGQGRGLADDGQVPLVDVSARAGGDSLMMDRFHWWMSVHGRSYPSIDEKLRRLDDHIVLF
jgi:hypothetical protein